ncbi:MAG: hypothetical protein Q8S53_06610, partial [Brevundimonas sp.]
RAEGHLQTHSWGYGRELFGAFRDAVSSAEEGASICFAQPPAGPPGTDTPPDPNVVDRTMDA